MWWVVSSAVRKWIRKDTRTRGHEVSTSATSMLTKKWFIKLSKSYPWLYDGQSSRQGVHQENWWSDGAWSCVSPSHTSHSTATRLKLGDSLPLFTGQNYNSVAAFIDETDCGTATTFIPRYLLLHNIIAHLLLNIVFKTILICCACQLDITKPAWKAWGCESCLTILP